MFHTAGMETVTIRELRQNWPAVEKRLAAAGKLTITRDGEAVALLAPPPKAAPRKAVKRFTAADHEKWMKKIWGDEKPAFSFSDSLERDRADRKF